MSRLVLLRDLEPGRLYKVAARSVANGVGSEWSQVIDVQTVSDTVAPNAPTALSWTVEGTAFKGTWTAPTLNEDGSALKDFKDYQITVYSSAAPAVKAVYYTTATRYDFPFESNVAAFGTPRASVTIEIRSRDNTGNISTTPATATASNPAPTTPANVSATGVQDGVVVKWDSVSDSDLKQYRVYYGTTLAGATTLVWSGLATAFTHRLTTYSTDAYYKVVSVDVFNTESVAASAGPVRPTSPFTVDTTAPSVPTGLAATLTNATDGKTASAAVSWTAVADTDNDLASYIIGFKPSSTTDWQYATVDYTNTSTTITGLLPYTNYDFRIRASDWAANLSAWSSTVTKTAAANGAPAVPTGLAVTAGVDNLLIRWTANTEPDMANGAGVYDVTVSTSSTFASGNLQYRTGADNIAVNGLSTATTYYVRVRATDSGGVSSAYSATVNATTGSFPVTPLSDGNPPSASPAPNVIGGVGYIWASWTPISNADPVTYEVHMSTASGFTPSASTKVGEVSGSTLIVRLTGAGAALAYGTNYYLKTIAKDRDGSAAASAQSAAVQMVKDSATDISATPRQLGVPTITTAATAPTSPINGDVWNDTTTGLEKQWNGTGWIATGNVAMNYIASRGTDLVTNGTGILGSNYNFPAFDYNGADAPTGANGSFVIKTTANQSSVLNELLPFDPSKQYKFSFQCRQTVSGQAGRMYGFFAPYDAFNNQISPQMYMYVANTTTTLAAPLNPGDTTVTLTSAANWYGSSGKPAGSSTYLRGFIFWDYVDSNGKAWPTESYSRNVYLSQWADGGISGNVITLSAAWTGPAKPAGTSVSNSTAGGTYLYMPSATNVLVPEAWTTYSDVFSAGIMPPSTQAVVGGGAATWVGGMPPGTAKLAVGWLLNYPSGGGKHAVAAVSVSDASAAQSAANTAMATADGKNKIIRSTSDASGTTGYVAGDLWWKIDASNNVIKQWKYTGSAWVTELLDDGVFNSISANKLAANSAFVTTLNVGAGGVIQSAGYTSGGTSGFQLSTSGLVIKGSGNTVDGGTIPANTIDVNSIKTSTLTATTITIGTGGIIQTATGGVQITNSGIVIPAGMLDANVLKGNTAFVTTLNIGAGGVIQSNGYTSGGTSGFQLSQTGLTIKGSGNTVDGGTIPASTLDVNAIKTSTLSATTISLGTNGVISVGVGGTISIDGSTGQLKSNNYAANSTGYRLSNAGLEINDGSVDAKVLKTGTAIIGDLTIGRSADALGTIKSFDYAAGSAGWKIGKGLFEINQGVIKAAAVQIQDSDNIVPAQFADFEFAPSYYTLGTSNTAMYSNGAPTTVTIAATSPKFNKQYLSASWAAAVTFDPYIYFAPSITTYNIPLEAGETYIYSAYARATGSVATNLILGGRYSNTTSFTGANVTLPASSSTWVRYSGTFTVPAGVTGTNIFVQSTTRTAGAGFEIDGIQIERKMGALNTPSPWTPPGSTSIDGAIIRTGQIQSNTSVTVNGTSQPSWSINMAGNAQFGDALVRGNFVVGQPNTNIAPGGGTFESNVTGYAVYSNGGGITGAAIARTTTTPISGTASALISATANSNGALGIRADLSTVIPAGAGFTLRFKFKADTDSSALTVALNDGTTSFLFDTKAKTDLLANTVYQFTKSYTPTSQVSKIYMYLTGTYAKNIYFDDVEILVDPDFGASSMRSGNFVTGISGWEIDSSGNVEMNNGVFRGTLQTVSITGADFVTSTNGGALIIDEQAQTVAYGSPNTYAKQGYIQINSAIDSYKGWALTKQAYITVDAFTNQTSSLGLYGPVRGASDAVASIRLTSAQQGGGTVKPRVEISATDGGIQTSQPNGYGYAPIVMTGTVSVGIVAAGATASYTVTFPAGFAQFVAVPKVFVNAESTRLNTIAASRTVNGFTFQVSNWTSAASSACTGTWVAIVEGV